jgi:hypothetical protein
MEGKFRDHLALSCYTTEQKMRPQDEGNLSSRLWGNLKLCVCVCVCVCVCEKHCHLEHLRVQDQFNTSGWMNLLLLWVGIVLLANESPTGRTDRPERGCTCSASPIPVWPRWGEVSESNSGTQSWVGKECDSGVRKIWNEFWMLHSPVQELD